MRKLRTYQIEALTKLFRGKEFLPRVGWIQCIREALGMSIQQFAKRLGVTRASAYRLESHEQEGTITFQSMQKAAKALHCRFVYVLVPEDSLEEIIGRQADVYIKEKVDYITHSMELEDQKPSSEDLEQIIKILQETLAAHPKKIWDDERP